MLLLPDMGRHPFKPHLQIFLSSFVRIRASTEDGSGQQPLATAQRYFRSNIPGTITHPDALIFLTLSPSPCHHTSYILASFTLEPRSSTLVWMCCWVSS